MTHIEDQYFALLTQDRTESADILDKRSMRGVKSSVVEKYSDQAHFIYELIQNADDAGATYVRFILEDDRLIFAHNGTRYFSVTNPATEDEDSDAGILGDINSITSIANSTKSKTEATIGKFGVGFKAVFQYTSTPHIYDPKVRFKIERFIVPNKLKEDFPGRNPEETLFVFPFDHTERDADEAYSDICEKLKALKYPILFLPNLNYISYEIGNTIGLYKKDIKESHTFSDTCANLICLSGSYGNKSIDKLLWLFSRTDSENRRYSVGYFVDNEGHLKPVNEPAFCFFPTKENTELKFLIHAPFLLTDSREGIRAGVSHNKNMVRKLSTLAADSIVYLRDIGLRKNKMLVTDDILNIIPVDEDDFNDEDDRQKISFKPFYTAIKDMFSEENILPAANSYVSAQHAYWASVPQLPKLFSDEQLAEIVNDSDAKWVFRTVGRQGVQRKDKSLTWYIDEITKTWIDEDVILNGRTYLNIEGIQPSFIEHQKIKWLIRFYKWISETSNRMETAKTLPLFLSQSDKAVPVYDGDDLVLFFPVDGDSDYTVVHSRLLKDKKMKAFFENIGVTTPSLKDEIFNKIFPKYDNREIIDKLAHFQKFFKYYKECPQADVKHYLSRLKEYEFLRFRSLNDDNFYYGIPDSIYYPTEKLISYFVAKPQTRFLDIETYQKLVDEEDKYRLDEFFLGLGVKYSISLVKRDIERREVNASGIPTPWATYIHGWTETTIDGCSELIDYIIKNMAEEKSFVLWDVLLKIIDIYCNSWKNLSSILRGECLYFYYTEKSQEFEAPIAKKLKTAAWLVNSDGDLVSAANVTVQSLSSKYDTESEQAKELLQFLNIADISLKDYKEEDEDDYYLSDSQKEDISFAKKIREAGIESIEEIEEFKRWKDCIKAAEYAQRQQTEYSKEKSLSTLENGDYHSEYDDDEFDENDGVEINDGQPGQKRETVKQVTRDIAKRARKAPEPKPYIPAEEDNYEEEDSDEYTHASVDYSKKIEKAKDKSAAEINRIAYLEELQKRAENSERYSYGWFTALLEIEAMNSGENNLNSREISISFAKVEREPGTNRTLVLKHPNRYIPQSIEDLADIPLILNMGNNTKTVAIEVVNVKSYTLRVKLKTNAEIDGIDLSTVTEARIDAKNPVFLLEELRKQFLKLGYDDDFDMQENLCENIEFVFGPPGTGKTTYLVRNIIIPLMTCQEDLKLLVLAPTNKAADVLVSRIMHIIGTDISYHNWLVRFGTTNDERIERSPIYRDKTFDIRTMTRNVTVTTIARFPYDFFMPQDARLHLNALNWDYIIIDEASMIPIANIVYPLYKKTPNKFIIAGDPFQIEPITSVNLWKNENIYTMVKLNSFIEPKTVPFQYKVTTLTTQYRSIPEIGDVYSKFAYGGILKHNRIANQQRKLSIEKYIDVSTLNIIKFPVSKYESIYRAKRLKGTSAYHIYSALFTYEFVGLIADKIAFSNPSEKFSIGVIAPYRAQADLIDKLMASKGLPDTIEVQVGTIHGFQGDECDIVIAVFNPPPSISTSQEMFLNKKNIINVSVSRARDYLFMLMPDNETENIVNLRLVRKVEALFKASGTVKEFNSHDLEMKMFGRNDYLEENTFYTSHQSVNVYSLPEKQYEIRTEDAAVDIQVHKQTSKSAVMQNIHEKSEKNPAAVRNADNMSDTNIRETKAVTFTWLNSRTEVCPIDGGKVINEAVPVIKKNGKAKKLIMLVCKKCKRQYMVKGTLVDSINLNDYYVRSVELYRKNGTGKNIVLGQAQLADRVDKVCEKEYIMSRDYGKGEVIAREPGDGDTIITIRFADCTKQFYENKAFSLGGLRHI